MVVKTTPIEFMHQLMYNLSNTYQDDSNKLNLALADLTGIAGLTQITYWTQLRDMIKADIINNIADGGTAKDFLKNYCNIDLDNEDCGALIGFDCSGGKVLTSDTIIDEQGDLQSHPSTAVIRGCTISFPTFSDTKYNYVLDGLYTWWIGLPFDLVKKSVGLEFNENSFIADMSINLFDTPPSGGTIVGAYVATWYDSDEKVALMELCVNMNDAAYGSIIIGNKNGDTTSGIVAPLDRALAHELIHAVMAANIRYNRICFPSWFKEGGTAELVVGCDDTRKTDLLQAAGDINIIDDGFSDNPTLARNYSVGFLAMRYLLKHYTENQIPIYFPDIIKEPFEKLWEKKAHGIRSEYCISRDGDLNKIVDEFIDFAQRDDYNLVQPWVLCNNKGSKTLRIPLEGHENKVEDEICILNANIISEEKIVNMSKVFNSVDAVTISDTLYAVIDDSGYLWFLTTPMYSMSKENSESISYGELGQDFDVYLRPFAKTPGYPFVGNVKWGCTPYYANEIDSAINDLVNKYASATNRKNIIVCFTPDSFAYYTLSHFVTLANAVISKNVGGKVKVFPLFKYSMIQFYTTDDTFLDDVVVFINTFKSDYPALADYVELDTTWFDEFGNICPLNISAYKSYLMFNENMMDFGTLCLEEIHRAIYDTSYPSHQIHAFTNWKVAKSGGFIVDSKKDTDFPCFYLSTGVFKPKDWDNQNLVYPTAVVDNQEDEYIPFNVHVLNDINMRFDLQGVGTCKKVTGKQNDADILNSIRQTGAHSYAADVISDLIPGIGCPLIVRAVANKDIYTDIMCYFTKTSYSGTFTLIFYNEADETIIPIFQSVAFGLGISEEDSYKYPLYTAGGTSGLLPAWYSFSYTIPGMPPRIVTLHIYGNKFNCDMTKGAMLNSLLYPTATERCNISNFRLLQPSGEWKSAINYRQYFYANVKDTIGSYIYKNDSDDIEDYLVYPTTSDTNLVDRFTLVQPVNVIKKHLTDENESGFTLSLNGVKCKPDRLRSVLQGLDGHEYLVIPNGWFDRMLGIPLRPMQSTEILVDVITELLNKMPKQSYVLCIDLG